MDFLMADWTVDLLVGLTASMWGKASEARLAVQKVATLESSLVDLMAVEMVEQTVD